MELLARPRPWITRGIPIQLIKALWSRFFPNPRFYGWAIIGLCFLCSALSSPGQSFAISLYIDHVMEALELTRLEISSLYGSMTLLAAFCLPFVGRLADRFSSRLFLSVVLAALGLASLLFSQVTTFLGLAVAFYFLRLIGQGSVGLGTLTIPVHWFRRYRSRALSVVGLGYAAGEMIFPALILGLIAWLGWRGSLTAMGVVYLVVFAPFIYLLLRERRPDEPFDGDVRPSSGEPTKEGEQHSDDDDEDDEDEGPNYPLSRILRFPSFWVMVLAASIFPMVVTGLIFHQVAIFDTMEWGARRIPLVFALFAAASMVMSYGTGFVLEHISARFAVGGALLVVVLALLTTLLPIAPLPSAIAYGTLLGVASGISATGNSVVW
ncbi:MAG: MFS transporter, partial [Bradymonadaceae bacterium]